MSATIDGGTGACTANSPECYQRAHDPRSCYCIPDRPLSAAEELRRVAAKVRSSASRWRKTAKVDENDDVIYALELVLGWLEKRAARLEKQARR